MTQHKTMLSIAFCPNGRYHLTYGKTIDSDEFIGFFQRARELWRKRRVNPLMFSDMHLQIDNAPSHRAKATKKFFENAGVTLIKQSPYSPDLNLCDCFLFRSMKSSFKSESFTDSNDVFNAATQFMNDLDKTFIFSEIRKLILHCNNFILCNGNYVDCSKYNCWDTFINIRIKYWRKYYVPP